MMGWRQPVYKIDRRDQQRQQKSFSTHVNRNISKNFSSNDSNKLNSDSTLTKPIVTTFTTIPNVLDDNTTNRACRAQRLRKHIIRSDKD